MGRYISIRGTHCEERENLHLLSAAYLCILCVYYVVDCTMVVFNSWILLFFFFFTAGPLARNAESELVFTVICGFSKNVLRSLWKLIFVHIFGGGCYTCRIVTCMPYFTECEKTMTSTHNPNLEREQLGRMEIVEWNRIRAPKKRRGATTMRERVKNNNEEDRGRRWQSLRYL